MIASNSNKEYGDIWRFVAFVILSFALVFVLFSCNSTRWLEAKSSSSSEIDNHYRDSVRKLDSTAISLRYEEKIKEMESDVSFYQNNETALVDALNELQDTISAKGQLTEDMKRRYNRVLDSIQALCSAKLKVYKDGSYEVSGPISKVNLQLKEMMKKMDSLAVHTKDTAAVVDNTVKEKEQTETVVEEKKKKGVPWLWIFIVGYILGAATIVAISYYLAKNNKQVDINIKNKTS